jgi:hypothetical protein
MKKQKNNETNCSHCEHPPKKGETLITLCICGTKVGKPINNIINLIGMHAMPPNTHLQHHFMHHMQAATQHTGARFLQRVRTISQCAHPQLRQGNDLQW